MGNVWIVWKTPTMKIAIKEFKQLKVNDVLVIHEIKQIVTKIEDNRLETLTEFQATSVYWVEPYTTFGYLGVGRLIRTIEILEHA